MERSTGSVKVTISGPTGDIPESFDVSFSTAMEMLHILGMGKWEETAPDPGQYGWKGDVWMENSQQARLQYLLQCIGLPDPDRIYSVLATETQRPRTYESSVTRARPSLSLTLNDRWYLDCCLNLPQKLQVVEALKHVGFSQSFIEMAKRFVAGKTRHGNMPFRSQHSSKLGLAASPVGLKTNSE